MLSPLFVGREWNMELYGKLKKRLIRYVALVMACVSVCSGTAFASYDADSKTYTFPNASSYSQSTSITYSGGGNTSFVYDKEYYWWQDANGDWNTKLNEYGQWEFDAESAQVNFDVIVPFSLYKFNDSATVVSKGDRVYFSGLKFYPTVSITTKDSVTEASDYRVSMSSVELCFADQSCPVLKGYNINPVFDVSMYRGRTIANGFYVRIKGYLYGDAVHRLQGEASDTYATFKFTVSPSDSFSIGFLDYSNTYTDSLDDVNEKLNEANEINTSIKNYSSKIYTKLGDLYTLIDKGFTVLANTLTEYFGKILNAVDDFKTAVVAKFDEVIDKLFEADEEDQKKQDEFDDKVNDDMSDINDNNVDLNGTLDEATEDETLQSGIDLIQSAVSGNRDTKFGQFFLTTVFFMDEGGTIYIYLFFALVFCFFSYLFFGKR